MRHFDVLIIGGGQAAFPLTDALVEAGKTVAIAERKHLGGSCVNFGCTPTKAALASASLVHEARRGSEFGLHFAGVEVHFSAVLTRARGIKEESREGLEDEYARKDNPKILRGHARLAGRGQGGFHAVIGSETVSATTVVLDTGTRTAFPPIVGLNETNCIHSGNWLDVADLPPRLAVLGGGVISLEMGQFYRRMGSDVTIFESGARIFPREDEDVAAELVKQLGNEKIKFKTGIKVDRIEQDGQGIKLTWAEGSEQFDNIFVATGRTPNTDDLGLETVDVSLDERGYVKVDDGLASSTKGIYAVGDIRPGPQFTHASWDDFRVMRSQLLGDGSRTTKGRVVPYAVFTDPELGRVGMTEKEARESERPIKVGKFEMTHNGLARERRKRHGFVKVIVDAEKNTVLGAAILAADASEMIQLYATMMVLDADYRIVRDSIVSHPTYMEAVQSALEAVE